MVRLPGDDERLDRIRLQKRKGSEPVLQTPSMSASSSTAAPDSVADQPLPLRSFEVHGQAVFACDLKIIDEESWQELNEAGQWISHSSV